MASRNPYKGLSQRYVKNLKMNIAIISPSLHCGGGAERLVEFHAKELHRRSHKVTVYCVIDEGEIGEDLRKNGIRVINLQCFKALSSIYSAEKKTKWQYNLDRIRRFFNEVGSSFKLGAIFLKDRPDVVHLYQNHTKMAIITSKICGVKKIIYTETSLIGDWFSPLQLFIIRIFWKFCDNLIVLSSSMKDHMLGLKLVDKAKICVIPSMFTLPYSNTRCVDERSRDFPIKIGTVGKLSYEKGHAYFLEAAGLIIKRSSNVRFIIAGDGVLREQLKDLSRRLGLEKKVEFIGKFRDIEDVMRRMDIFVLASLTEGMPVSIIEAMAYGKPVVATDVGGVRELVKDGETGFIVPARDPEALAEAVNRLITNPQKSTDFVKRAIKRFNDLYSSEKVVPQIELLYQSN